MKHTLTVRFELWEGDVTPHRLLPMPNTGICEVVHADFREGEWHIVNAEPNAPRAWTGHAEIKQVAILAYLKARLGIGETYEKTEQAE